jgi:hypothetical protein
VAVISWGWIYIPEASVRLYYDCYYDLTVTTAYKQEQVVAAVEKDIRLVRSSEECTKRRQEYEEVSHKLGSEDLVIMKSNRDLTPEEFEERMAFLHEYGHFKATEDEAADIAVREWKEARRRHMNVHMFQAILFATVSSLLALVLGRALLWAFSGFGNKSL